MSEEARKNDDATKDSVKSIRMFAAALAVNISAIAVGTGMGWTSPVGPKLIYPDRNDSPLTHPIDHTSGAWIGAIMTIGAAITPFVAGPLADQFGRKATLMFSAVFFIVAYLILIFSIEVWIMLLARLIIGFGIGFVMTVVPMYVGEIATDNLRGSLGSFMSLFICVGALFVMSFGPFVSYYELQYLCLCVPIVFLIAFSFMPESPYFYVAKNKKGEALKALKFFRGQSSFTVEKELISIETMVEASMLQKGTFQNLIQNHANRKALFICLGLITFQQISGVNAVLFNYQAIFDSANMELSGEMAAIIVTAVQVVAAGIAPCISDRFGRKTILSISAFFMTIGLALLGVFFFIEIETDFGDSVKWLPVPAMIIYLIMFIFGYGPIPWAILGEMFAPNIKPIATSMVASHCWISGFFVTLVYPLLQYCGIYYAFWLFALSCVVALFFSMFVVMETRGLSLQEIQNRLMKN